MQQFETLFIIMMAMMMKLLWSLAAMLNCCPDATSNSSSSCFSSLSELESESESGPPPRPVPAVSAAMATKCLSLGKVAKLVSFAVEV